MDDLSFAGYTDYGLADLLRSRIRERDQADGKNSVLHASLVHEVARVERAVAIRNAREQARLDAVAAGIIDLTVIPEREIRTLREENARLMRLTDPSEIRAAVIRSIVDAQDHGLGQVALGVMTAIADSVSAMLSGGYRAAAAKAERDAEAGAMRAPVDLSAEALAAIRAHVDRDSTDLTMVQASGAQIVALLDEVQRLRSERSADAGIAMESTDERLHPERIKMAVTAAMHAHDGVMIGATDRDDIADRVVESLCGPPDERVLPADCVSIGEHRGAMAEVERQRDQISALETEVARLTKLLEHAEMASEIAAESRAEDAGRIKSVVAEVVRDRVACVAGWSGFAAGSIERMIEEVAQRCANRLTGVVSAPVDHPLSDDERKQLRHHIEDYRATSPLSCALVERLLVASAPAQGSLDVAFLRRVTSRTKHGPHESGGSGPCAPDCLKCEAERRIKGAPDPLLGAEDLAALQRLSDYTRTWAVEASGRAVIDRLLAAHGAKP